MGSLAQNSSGVHWCRRRVRFNEVPKRFRVRFNRVPEKVPEKVGERFRGRSGRSRSKGFPRRFRRRSGRVGAHPGRVQQGSGEDSGEGCR